jgi:dipeptidyl aminopeptidase/acylaminoacyl peptidase
VLVAFGAFWSAGAVASASESGLTSADLVRLRGVAGVALSPDGATVAYTLTIPRDPLKEKDGPSMTELWVAPAGGAPRAYVTSSPTGDANVGSISFTPDGGAIAFLAKRGGDKNRALWSIGAAGGEATRVVEADGDVTAYAFHPTLRRVAYVAAPAPVKTKRELQDKGFNQEVFEEDLPNARLLIADLDAGGAPKAVELAGHVSDVAWSADGKRLLVTTAPTPLVDDSYMRKHLETVDVETRKVVGRIETKGKLGPAVISASGKYVAFVGAADEHDPQPGRLFWADAAGGAPKELLPDFQGHFVSCAFAGSDALVYLADRGVETVVGRVLLAGTSNQELLADAGQVVTAFALSRDGKKAALVMQSAALPSEAYRLDLGAKPVRVSDSNPWLASRKLAAQELFQWKARDGLDLSGILVDPIDRPAGAPTTRRYPLIVAVHGGPEAHVRNGWNTSYSNPGQIAAAEGYAVFYPNYRGSTGRGVAFSMLDHLDPGGKEFDDIVDGVEALVRYGLVDEKKVGITGGSYGGYATGWCCTKYSEKFAAGVMGFGVSDLISMLGVTDIPTEHYLVHHRLHPWEDWNLFVERSPIYHATKCRTPLLILAGKADPRVPPSQSMELYRYLKAAAPTTPVRLVQYPGEQHGNSRAASRLDYHLRMMQWFDLYLKGDGKGEMPAATIDYAGMLGTK